MIILKPYFYDDFECIADKCILTCCHFTWRIDIDEETFQKYQKIEGELGDKIRANIISEKSSDGKKEVHRIKETMPCPLLNEKGLCEIVLQKGPEYLSETCTKFPRASSIYDDDLTEKKLFTSCPAVVDFLYEKKHFEFIQEEEGKTNVNNILNFTEFNLRKVVMGLLQTEQFPLAVKQFFVLDFLSEIKNFYKENNVPEMKKVISKFVDFNYLMDSAKEAETKNMDSESRFNDLYAILKGVMEKIGTGPAEFSCDITLPLDKLIEEEKYFNEHIFKDIEHFFENLCVNEIYNFFIKNSRELDPYATCGIIFLEAAIIKLAMFILWLSNEHRLIKDKQNIIIAEISRLFANRSNFYASFYNDCKDKDFFMNALSMYMLIK